LDLQSTQAQLFQGRLLRCASLQQKPFILNQWQLHPFGHLRLNRTSFGPGQTQTNINGFGSFGLTLELASGLCLAGFALEEGVESADNFLGQSSRLVDEFPWHIKHE